LAVIRKISLLTHGQCNDETLDSRARVMLSGPTVDVKRGCRAQGFVTEISQRWANECRRQHAPASTKKIGKQGALPQRAPKRRAGENRVVFEVEPEGECPWGVRGHCSGGALFFPCGVICWRLWELESPHSIRRTKPCLSNSTRIEHQCRAFLIFG